MQGLYLWQSHTPLDVRKITRKADESTSSSSICLLHSRQTWSMTMSTPDTQMPSSSEQSTHWPSDTPTFPCWRIITGSCLHDHVWLWQEGKHYGKHESRATNRSEEDDHQCSTEYWLEQTLYAPDRTEDLTGQQFPEWVHRRPKPDCRSGLQMLSRLSVSAHSSRNGWTSCSMSSSSKATWKSNWNYRSVSLWTARTRTKRRLKQIFWLMRTIWL